MVVLYHSFPLGTLLLHFFSFLYSVNFLVQDLGALNYPSGFWSSFALFYVVHLIVSCCSNYYYFLCFSFSELPDPAFRLSPPWNSKITGETFQASLYIYFDNDVCRSQLGREFHDGRLRVCTSQVGVILLLSSGREFCGSSLLS